MGENRKKVRVAQSSVLASALLTGLKISVAIMTGSIGIISEAAHSALDLGAASLTWFAVRMSGRPADDKHHYGHAKVESLSALIQAGLLLLTSAWIILEAFERLGSGAPAIGFSWYAVAVLLVSIGVDISRSRALRKVARETGSQALEADALHFASDILSSAVVLFGLVCVWMGYEWADPVAGMAVALLIGKAAWGLGRETIDVLTDAAPEGIAERVEELAAHVDGVVAVEKIRVKPTGPMVYIELAVSVNRTLSVEKVKQICDRIEANTRNAFPIADMAITTTPVALTGESIAERVHVIGHNHGLHAHNIATSLERARKLITFDVEIDQRLTIREAHSRVSMLEEDLRREFDGDLDICIHIDPLRCEERQASPLPEEAQRRVSGIIVSEAARIGSIADVHDIRVLKTEKQKLFITLHCSFRDSVLLEEAHSLTSQLEGAIYKALPDACRVIIHAEPLVVSTH